MDDLTELYQAIILQHNRRPKNEGELPDKTHEAEGYNTLCGDRITVFIKLGDSVDEVRFVGEGCAISRASASILTMQLKGLAKEAAENRVIEVVDLLTRAEEPEIDLDKLGDLAALVGVRKFPARVKCATLGWHTFQAALRGERKMQA